MVFMIGFLNIQLGIGLARVQSVSSEVSGLLGS